MMKWKDTTRMNLINGIITAFFDIRFLFCILMFGVLCLVFDPMGSGALRVVFWVLLFWGLSFFIRRCLMPYSKNAEGQFIPMRLSDFMRRSYETPLSASIVVCAVIYLMCSIANSFILWMR